MISSKRLHKAEREGVRAYIATKGNPYLVEINYQRWSAQHKRFNKGWNSAKRKFKFLRRL